MFQNSVKRNYTTGFPGDIVRDGPMRAKPARISSATLGADPGASTNRISRAYGYNTDVPLTGSTFAASEALVNVGGAKFFGLLGNRYRYANEGTQDGGTLAATLDLPQNALGEFFDMVTGMVTEFFNETTGSKTMTYGDQIAYVPNTISAGNNPLALPYGALISVPAGSAAPTGMVLIPNARVINTSSLGASALGALVSGYSISQLTQ